jgi:GTP cyclohydrolase II
MRLSDIHGYDTFDAYEAIGIAQDIREYRLAALIILELGRTSIRLMTNNYRKVEGLIACGVDVVKVVPHVCTMRPEIISYLRAKETKLGHRIGLAGDGHR